MPSLNMNSGSAPAAPSSGNLLLYSTDGVTLLASNSTPKVYQLAKYQIDRQTVGASGLITFSNIPQTPFRHLMIEGLARATTVAAQDFLGLRFGTGGGAVDTGNNYGQSYISCINTTRAGSSSAAVSSAPASLEDFAGSNVLAFTPVCAFIGDYTGAYYKYVCGIPAHSLGTPSAATTVLGISGGSWRNTGAITSIQAGGANGWTALAIGSYLNLYGII